MSDAPVLRFPNCYVCGSDNPQGLHVEFTRDGPEGCRAQYTARGEHEGWPGIMHGGVLFTLMDEAAAWALAYAGMRGVTVRGGFHFCTPAKVGTPLVITARVVERKRKLVQVRAEIHTADAASTLVAELESSMYLTDVEQWERTC